MDLDPAMQQIYDAPYLVIHRAELLNAMAEKAKDIGITILLGSVIESIDFSKPSISMEDKSVLEADFIIGADGERSFCRDALLGHRDPPHHNGDIVYKDCDPDREVARGLGITWLGGTSSGAFLARTRRTHPLVLVEGGWSPQCRPHSTWITRRSSDFQPRASRDGSSQGFC